MANETQEFLEKFKSDFAKMKEQVPDMVSGFGGLFAKIMKDGAITLREKELIALAIGVTQQCKPCIRLHVQKCLVAGATKEQILEASSVAVMMAGGPAYTHIPVVMDALKALGSQDV